MRGTRNMYEFRQQVISKRWVVEQYRSLMSYWDFYAARRRRRHAPATANISSTKLAGSGTEEFAIVSRC
jgi:hypothetical protein